jgi:Fic family protein
MTWKPQNLPYSFEMETKMVLKALAKANRSLAELKGIAQSIPRQEILINTLMLQEAKDSSEIENIVTTHDELYKNNLFESLGSLQNKEVQFYISAIRIGFELVRNQNALTINTILKIQQELEKNNAGFRKLPGTLLKNQQTGEVIFEPPQNNTDILCLMQNLELFINDHELSEFDPILKMAIIHFQFESIHPFYDGNGRTGRIINILYLILNHLLDFPVLYISRYIITHKSEYYQYLQGVRENNEWESWLLYMIRAVDETSQQTVQLIHKIKTQMAEVKLILRNNYKFYSQQLLNHLFKQPCTKIEFLAVDLNVSRITAANYLNTLADDGILSKQKLGKSNYYINSKLMVLITNV